jgi:hypothetical protein
MSALLGWSDTERAGQVEMCRSLERQSRNALAESSIAGVRGRSVA